MYIQIMSVNFQVNMLLHLKNVHVNDSPKIGVFYLLVFHYSTFYLSSASNAVDTIPKHWNIWQIQIWPFCLLFRTTATLYYFLWNSHTIPTINKSHLNKGNFSISQQILNFLTVHKIFKLYKWNILAQRNGIQSTP